MIRKSAVLFIVLACLVTLTACQSEKAVKMPESDLSPNKSASQEQSLDMGRGVIIAKGVGLPPKTAVSDEQAKLLARRAAIADAQRNLTINLQAIERRAGIVSTNTVVKNFRIVGEKQLPDGSYQIVLEMKLDASLMDRLRRQ